MKTPVLLSEKSTQVIYASSLLTDTQLQEQLYTTAVIDTEVLYVSLRLN